MKKYVCEVYEKQYFGMFDKKLYFLMEADAPEEIEGIAAEESKYMMRSDEEIAEIIKMIAVERQEELRLDPDLNGILPHKMQYATFLLVPD